MYKVNNPHFISMAHGDYMFVIFSQTAAALTNIFMTKTILTRRTVSVAALKTNTISSLHVLITTEFAHPF